MDGWTRAEWALRLLAHDPSALGGAVVRLRAGPARDRARQWLQRHLPGRQVTPATTDDQLFGGLDITAALAKGTFARRAGLLTPTQSVHLIMAERCDASMAAKLAAALDHRQARALIAYDEGADPEEHCPNALSERLAFFVSPEGRMPDNWLESDYPVKTTKTVSSKKISNENNAVPAGTVKIDAESIDSLTTLAARLGIDSLRVPTLAIAAAKAHASLLGKPEVGSEDIEMAAALVFPHRATQMPQPLEDDPAETPPAPPEDHSETPDAEGDDHSLPQGDLLVEAVTALLPPDVLAGLVPAGTARQSSGNGAGRQRIGNRRGRPLPARSGRPDGRARIDLVATLRAAAPWQTIRRATAPNAKRVHIRPSDIRLKRFAELSDRLLVFTVDASGSAAVTRLNEAKGAIELLLAEAYAARDHVALVAFRGEAAEVLLPPTRSLVQTKRRLAALPGGGGTPLATGLQDAGLLAQKARQRGMTPTVVLITDGRANITLDGHANRSQAGEDSTIVAKALRSDGIPALVIDAGLRPSRALGTLAEVLDAPYVPLPRADAQKLSQAVSGALSDA